MSSPASTPATPGSPFIAYQHGELCIEQCRAEQLAQQHGTPLYVYSNASMQAAALAYQQPLARIGGRAHYAVKANANLSVLKRVASWGLGFDVVSGGELQRVRLAAGAQAPVVFSGVGKTRAELELALRERVACLNVESEAELHQLSQVAAQMGCEAPFALRVNPDVDALTHPYISTGLRNNKFGVPHAQVVALHEAAAQLPGLRAVGMACHIGSQITQLSPYLDALERVLDLIEEVQRRTGVRLLHLDLGGGLAIRYSDEQVPVPTTLIEAASQRLLARGLRDCRLWLEPGRSIVGNAGVLLTRVLAVKQTEHKTFFIVDAAMNDLARPALYEAYHAISSARLREDVPELEGDVVGPVCESGDWLGRDRCLRAQAGDLLVVHSAGAYGFAMASQYNSRPRAAEVLVQGAEHDLIRRRERVEDLWSAELDALSDGQSEALGQHDAAPNV